MRRLIDSFHHLQWKLTLYYTLVSVLALSIILMLFMIFFGGYIIYNSFSYIIVNALDQVSNQVAPALSTETPDQQAISAWANDFDLRQILKSNMQNSQEVPPNDNQDDKFLSYFDFEETVLFVIDKNGRLLASSSTQNISTNTSLILQVTESEQEIIRAAMSGTTEANQLSLSSSREQLLSIAYPIFSSDQQYVAGVFLLRMPLLSFLEVLKIVITPLFRSLLVFTIFAATVGILFGIIVARNLTKRLNLLTHITSVWSNGDFSQRVTDKSQDEIGKLGRDLNVMADELQNLIQTRQDLAASEERNHLARELHDSVKQQVFAITMNLGAAQKLWQNKPDKAFDKLESAATLAGQVQNELSALIQTLRPVQLEEKGLLDVLRDYTRSWEKHSGIAAIFQAEGIVPELPVETSQALFRVTQEGLSNIARHSSATAASLHVKTDQTHIRMVISDNGKGFDLTSPNTGMGILSMKERVQTLGGDFSIESRDTGVQIMIDIPLQNDENKLEAIQ